MIEMTSEISDLACALSLAQGQMTSAERSRENSHLKSKYATLDSVWDAIRKPLSDQGLSVIQSPAEIDGGMLRLMTILLHKSGQRLWDTFIMPIAQVTPQGVGSAITYARRYTLMAIVGIAPDDDDAEAAQPAPAKQQNQYPAPVSAPPELTEAEKAAQTESRRFWSIAAKFGILPTALDDAQCDAWLTTLLAHPIPAEFTAATWKTLGSGMRAYGKMAAADVAMLEPAFILAYVQRTWKEVGSLLQMSNGMWQGVIGMIEEETAEKAHLKECAAPLELLEAPAPVELQTPGAFK